MLIFIQFVFSGDAAWNTSLNTCRLRINYRYVVMPGDMQSTMQLPVFGCWQTFSTMLCFQWERQTWKKTCLHQAGAIPASAAGLPYIYVLPAAVNLATVGQTAARRVNILQEQCNIRSWRAQLLYVM
jgi:hypothetical protein